ncbi:hypothetical protein OSB04_021964 [Centaurea solstitialis]|uniref:Uncharacterized protein n=1 Tax=Centaurea solstitialis TaxID=347529 RepID=A0AA38T8M0_9ASTR|nr:hypothetical protein OSB04_021964 [Centaurea solstitialis]
MFDWESALGAMGAKLYGAGKFERVGNIPSKPMGGSKAFPLVLMLNLLSLAFSVLRSLQRDTGAGTAAGRYVFWMKTANYLPRATISQSPSFEKAQSNIMPMALLSGWVGFSFVIGYKIFNRILRLENWYLSLVLSLGTLTMPKGLRTHYPLGCFIFGIRKFGFPNFGFPKISDSEKMIPNPNPKIRISEIPGYKKLEIECTVDWGWCRKRGGGEGFEGGQAVGEIAAGFEVAGGWEVAGGGGASTILGWVCTVGFRTQCCRKYVIVLCSVRVSNELGYRNAKNCKVGVIVVRIDFTSNRTPLCDGSSSVQKKNIRRSLQSRRSNATRGRNSRYYSESEFSCIAFSTLFQVRVFTKLCKRSNCPHRIKAHSSELLQCGFETLGVAIGAGWQYDSCVYERRSYFFFGITMSLLMGFKFDMGVKVTSRNWLRNGFGCNHAVLLVTYNGFSNKLEQGGECRGRPNKNNGGVTSNKDRFIEPSNIDR